MFDPHIHTLHRQHRHVRLYEASDIPTALFGSDAAVGLVGDQSVSIEHEHAFLLRACGHVITSIEELGQTCAVCAAIAAAVGLPNPEFAARCCTACTRQCAEVTCKCYLCPVHATQHPADGQWYCPAHFERRTRDAFIAERGWCAWWCRRLVRLLFLCDEEGAR